ncbi:unnamed protein product [Rotaria sordida]|uniref:Uncharacterized protein n=2 Tax=Rotaria sordida TaxID=392033 RepID=A0A814L294_9BILA|nr:unnamed protein product [Rotaria sordida]
MTLVFLISDQSKVQNEEFVLNQPQIRVEQLISTFNQQFITDPYQRRIVHENLIGKQGQGFEIAMCNLNDYRFNINNSSLNAAQASIHNPGEHLKVRKQCDKSLDQFQI